MLVGHTHDDIDALFGKWSMVLRKENFPMIPLLMKYFMEVESILTIPHLLISKASLQDILWTGMRH
jgi:hypothetical protein